jgi:hypothetical protein
MKTRSQSKLSQSTPKRQRLTSPTIPFSKHSIRNLPTVSLLNIFSFLPLDNTVFQSLVCTCKQWNKEKTRLVLLYCPTTYASVSNLLCIHLLPLTRLKLFGYNPIPLSSDFGFPGLQHLGMMQDLQELTLDLQCDYRNIEWPPNLTCLRLREDIPIPSSCKKLKKLVIFGTVQRPFRLEDMHTEVFEALCPLLEELDLQDSLHPIFLPDLSRCPLLHTLKLPSNHMFPILVRNRIFDLLPVNCLRTLEISRLYCLSFLSAFPSLTSLTCTYGNFDNVDAIAAFPLLTSLRLSYSKYIRDVDAIIKCKDLQYVYLNNCTSLCRVPKPLLLPNLLLIDVCNCPDLEMKWS